MRIVLPAWFLLLLSFAAPMAWAAPEPCHDDRVQETTGSTLSTSLGWIFELYPGSNLRIGGTWLPMDHLKICPLSANGYEITNLDRGQSSKGLYIN